MEISPFFQKLWRFNAVIIALAGLAGMLMLLLGSGVIAYEIYKDLTRKEHDQVITTDSHKPIKESLNLGSMVQISGHNSLYFALYGEQTVSEGFSSYSKGDTRSTRNYLFFNMENNQSHWLLPGHNYLILDHQAYPKSYDDDLPVLAITYEIVYNDSNHNKLLNSNDKSTLAISTPQGKRLTNVIEDIDWIVGKHLLDNSTLVVTYKKAGKTLLSRIDLNNFTIQSPHELDTTLHSEEIPHQNPSP